MKASYNPLEWKGFGQFTVVVAREAAQRQLAAGWLEAEHFLGSFQPVGHSLLQIIEEDGLPVAVVQWAACAYHLKDREAFIGWDALTCAKRRNLIVNNVRFLVREAARRPNLASKSLAHAIKELPGQWREHFGYEPLLAETFTDPESHAGTCYKSAGWTPLGMSEGNRRQRAEFYLPNGKPKKLWVKPLRRDACERLCAPALAPEHALGEREGKGAPLPVRASQLVPLAKALRAVPDPRRSNRFHPLPALLCLVSLGLLCGADNLNAVLRHAARLTQVQRRHLGLRRRKGALTWEMPDYETLRRVLRHLDIEALSRVLSEWLSAHRGALPAHLAMDGKTIRVRLGTIVTLCDIESKMPVAVAATTQPGGEQSAARELLRRESTCLLNATVSLDALYANEENARLIVQEKGGDYLVSLKNNQPTVLAHATAQLEGAPFLNRHPSRATENSSSGKSPACR